MIRNRDDLKGAFRSGAIPTAANFADLIDSFALVDETSALGKQIGDLDGRTAAVERKVAMPTTVVVNADGAWQVLKAGLDAIVAYEVLAHINKTKTSPYAAVTHAVAIAGATGARPSVRQTQSYSRGYWSWGVAGSVLTAGAGAALAMEPSWLGAVNISTWGFWGGIALGSCSLIGLATCLFQQDRRAVTVKWRTSGKWFDPNPKYDLVIRSGCDYGSETQKVPITCQLEWLWS